MSKEDYKARIIFEVDEATFRITGEIFPRGVRTKIYQAITKDLINLHNEMTSKQWSLFLGTIMNKGITLSNYNNEIKESLEETDGRTK